MGSKRQDTASTQVEEAPVSGGSDAAAAQNDLFGDMIKAQAENRKKQLDMRMSRLAAMGYGNGGFGFVPNSTSRLEGILGALRMLQEGQSPQQPYNPFFTYGDPGALRRVQEGQRPQQPNNPFFTYGDPGGGA